VATLHQDEAAVYRLTDDRAVVASIDFFTPIVDDPYTFGAIAAANALSDIYAMGATPLFALNILAWPRDPDMLALVGEAVRGTTDKATEAGVFVLGGHSIEDPEPKMGMVVFGEVHPDKVMTNAAARAHDHLILTKPIGTGILATALKRGAVDEADIVEAIRSMTTLNSGALAAIRSAASAVHAVTDVTGFGLIGHLHEMLAASGVSARLSAGAVPVFPRVRDFIANGTVPGGTERNRAAADAYTTWSPDVADADRTVLCDAQTSGGLLLSVEAGAVTQVIAALENAGVPVAADIGVVAAGTAGTRVVEAWCPPARRPDLSSCTPTRAALATGARGITPGAPGR
jgi:selenide,water dikinase